MIRRDRADSIECPDILARTSTDPLGIFRSTIVVALAATLVIVTPPASRAGEAAISLATFESMIDGAPGLAAASAHVRADQKAEGVASAKSGLDYVFNAAFGPRSDIVINNINNNTVRYAQSAGLGLPLLGTDVAQKNAIASAATDESVARIALAEERRTRLSNLRDAYVLYWQYDGQQRIAERYVRDVTAEVGPARSLRRNGFWTEANVLDFFDALSRFQTDVRTLRSSRRSELASIASALGTGVAPFRPLEPTLAAACFPRRDDAVRSAEDVDAGLARIAAQTALLETEAKRVRGSSIDAHATAALGNVFDLVPPRAGYELTAGVAAQLPTHARSEERSLRDELNAEIDEQHLLAGQRRAELSAAIEAAIDELANAREELAQTQTNERAKREDLRESMVRFKTLSGTGAAPFDDVQTNIAELFVAENATAIARGSAFLKANALLLLAPDACS
jgi:hypothetical protein